MSKHPNETSLCPMCGDYFDPKETHDEDGVCCDACYWDAIDAWDMIDED